MLTRRALMGAPLAAAAALSAAPAAAAGAFPPGFTWGFAAASAQTEGDAASRGRSIWDDFAERPGAIKDGSNPSEGTDFARRFAEDLDLAAGRGGANAFRFSFAWPRVLPEGAGAPSAAGLAFYDRLLDAMLARGLEPWPTLYHWDLPSALQARGGWPERDTALRFADYAELVGRRFGDRLRRVLVLNEAEIHAMEGHGKDSHAPGLASREAFFAAAHHLNLGQGLAMRALRAAAPGTALGSAMSLRPVRPAKPGEDAAAERLDALSNRLFLDPPFRAGRYPAILEAELAPWLREGDAALVGQRPDLLGVNYYAPAFAAAGGPFGAEQGDSPYPLPATRMGFMVEPESLATLLRRLRDEYGNPPVWITENGASYEDPAPDAAGVIQDPERRDYLRDHLLAASRAAAEGCDLRGYFCWTLTDNWEWAKGYTQPFGLVAVDRATGRRVPKASLDAFGGWARANRVA